MLNGALEYYTRTLGEIEEAGNLRSVPAADSPEGLTDLSSNDYLGLASRADLRERFLADAARRAVPMSASAARLLSGTQSEFTALEELLSTLYRRPALLFNSGYHANAGLVSALASAPGTVILADRLVHASIIDGITLSRAPFRRFRHNDAAHLASMIEREEAEGKAERILVIVESVYSMDGDRAPLAELVELRRRHPRVMLYVDEAHAFGVLGPQGLGLTMGLADPSEVDVVVGTFGKAACSAGAFAIMHPDLRAWAVNRARSFIFSTALPPLQAAWSRFMTETILGMDAERAHLARLGELLAPALGAEPGHIMALVTGDPVSAVARSRELIAEGFKVLPIRVPTVPPGTDRLRISLNASLSEDEVRRFKSLIR
ncbi:MAG: 8-amino-7-oxononanoate synthase [Duncaniella sp.]|nr:8-amino-7-oxononanoate synthase [Duncaniella sp.]